MDESLARHVAGTFARYEPDPNNREAAYLAREPKPMRDAGTAEWDVEISAEDFIQLKLGFQAKEMEDKWIIAATGPDEKGIISIRIIRSWLNMQIYVLHIRPVGDAGGARIESFTWEKALGQDGDFRVSERQAKKEAVVLCRIHAYCKLEQLPEYNPNIFWKKDSDDEDEENNKDKDTIA
ncbi:hypothetical protein PspLS_10683 [Pyricularia sp. CBS 133598]|nr:hypothetical protein PspLS_10683 [Pyricularia sp. CBS 133598]